MKVNETCCQMPALIISFKKMVSLLIMLNFLSNSYELNDSMLKVIFIDLASLTFPHILLEYLIEKNEQ